MGNVGWEQPIKDAIRRNAEEALKEPGSDGYCPECSWTLLVKEGTKFCQFCGWESG
jgi:hypothetical protein